jgi:DNA repair ATPase RecN
MRNKTKKSKPSELDKLKELQTLTLKRKKLQQDLEVLDYQIDQISPYSPDEQYDQLDKVRKQLLYAKGGLILSVLIIAVLFNVKSKKTGIALNRTSSIPPNAPTPVNVKGFYQ